LAKTLYNFTSQLSIFLFTLQDVSTEILPRLCTDLTLNSTEKSEINAQILHKNLAFYGILTSN